ncbi:MAG TPA: M28 family peptidase [Gemmatimonadaceae bacterium]|nr:M28 family peptidase [Gemmatimonadaceae bacterium]
MRGVSAKTVFNGDSALAYANVQVAFGPRVPGTPAHVQAGDWIVAQMRQRADSVEVQEWTHVTQSGQRLPMRNIIARFAPERTSRVLYVTHWDTRPTADSDRNLGARQRPIPGANDGASGVGLFVALADALRKSTPSVGVDLLFVDGEDWGQFEDVSDTTKNKDVLIGSQYFARTMPASYMPIFGVVWDMIGDASLQIFQEGHSVNSAPEVVARVWGVARELGYDRYFQAQTIAPITDDHVPFIRKGLRVIDVIDIDYCSDGSTGCGGDNTRNLHHTQGDTMDKLSAKSLQVVGDVALTLVTR